jgi:hypothetical protein
MEILTVFVNRVCDDPILYHLLFCYLQYIDINYYFIFVKVGKNFKLYYTGNLST